jgi:hypothetical protein
MEAVAMGVGVKGAKLDFLRSESRLVVLLSTLMDELESMEVYLSFLGEFLVEFTCRFSFLLLDFFIREARLLFAVITP